VRRTQFGGGSQVAEPSNEQDLSKDQITETEFLLEGCALRFHGGPGGHRDILSEGCKTEAVRCDRIGAALSKVAGQRSPKRPIANRQQAVSLPYITPRLSVFLLTSFVIALN
jgi:hypothetical protein